MGINIKEIRKKYKLGIAQPQWKCCRECRLVPVKEVGEVIEGFNTNTEEKEIWIAIRIDKKPFYSIVQKILD